MIDKKKLINFINSKEFRIKLIRSQGTIQNIQDVLLEFIEERPKSGKWIPCSERLPECGKRYLVTGICRDGEFKRRSVYDAVYGSDGSWHTRNYKPVAHEVDAWQPLPEPYKDDGDNMTDSASEKDIIRNHVSIIIQMLDAYNEAMEFDYGEGLQYPNIPNWKVVQELLLRGTAHAGKTSSIKKCEEMGIAPWENAFYKREED